MGLLVHFLTV